MAKVYRSRTAHRMTWQDWRIALAIAFPFAVGVLLIAAVILIG